MLKKCTIPCLDVKDGRVVKGANFVNLTDTGDPVNTTCAYYGTGCDELVFLDIIITHEKRDTTMEMVKRVANQVFIPFTADGGICPVEDMNKMLKVGAGKVVVNSSAVASPRLIKDCAEKFGSQCVVSAIDVRKEADGTRHAYVAGRRRDTGVDLIERAETAVSLGTGEILLTGMDKDGTKSGFDLDMLNAIADVVNVPIIVSGGVGNIDHTADVFGKTAVTGALTASIFHFDEVSITDTKTAMVAAKTEAR